MADPDSTYSGDGGAAAIVAGLLFVVLLVIGGFYFVSFGRPSSEVIDIVSTAATPSALPGGQWAHPI